MQPGYVAQNDLGLSHDSFSDRSDCHRMFRTVEEGDTQLFLQFEDHRAQGGLCDAALFGGFDEVAMTGQCRDVLQLLQGHGMMGLVNKCTNYLSDWKAFWNHFCRITGSLTFKKTEKMGKEAVKIAKLDVGKLFNDMNVALAEEWLVDFFWRRENLFKEKERV